MSPDRTSRTGFLAVVLAAALAVIGTDAALAGPGKPLPYDLGIEVRILEGSNANEALRENVELALLEDPEIRSRFRSVKPHDPETADASYLVLLIGLVDMEEEIRHEMSLAYQQQRSTSEDEMRTSVFLRVIANLDVVRPSVSDTAVLSDRFDKRTLRRPRYLGEDPRDLAVEKILEELIRRARRITGKINPKKLSGRPAEEPPAR